MTAAPVTESGLASALRPFGESTMLPAEAYTSDEVLAWERRHFFAGSWVCVGRVEALLPDGTTQHACTVGDVPVLLVREPGSSASASASASAEVRAFANTCRHRGHELLGDGESSSKRALVCPYHAWSYDLAGCLLAAPGFREVGSFEPSAHGLVPLPVQVWHGWVFVNASGESPTSLEDHVGGLT